LLQGIVLVLHIVVCALLIMVVLVQSGKSADLAGAFGGYGSQSTFGPRGTATFLSKMTTVLAVLFMITSLLLWINSSKKSGSGSVLPAGAKSTAAQTQTAQPKPPVPAPAQPAEKTAGQTNPEQKPQ
jgi:preprotein translocase subunit SecG